jgi:hypothetical protein
MILEPAANRTIKRPRAFFFKGHMQRHTFDPDKLFHKLGREGLTTFQASVEAKIGPGVPTTNYVPRRSIFPSLAYLALRIGDRGEVSLLYQGRGVTQAGCNPASLVGGAHLVNKGQRHRTATSYNVVSTVES